MNRYPSVSGKDTDETMGVHVTQKGAKGRQPKQGVYKKLKPNKGKDGMQADEPVKESAC